MKVSKGMRNLATVSLDEKIGQLFICGFDGLEENQGIIDLIENDFISGVCYFSRNTKDPQQLNQLSRNLQSHAKEGAPLFLSIDQEGGMVVRIDQGVTSSPGNMALGGTNRPEYAYEMAQIVGQELKAMGINFNFAPSVDVNNNPDNPVIGVRSFGEDQKLVAAFGAEAIKGYQDAGIAASAKHFPGHGDTATDSHLGLPIIRHSLERMEEVELYPFKQAIEAGVDSIMVSHLCFPAIEEEVPATISKKLITDLLRGTYHYEGIVITDCIEMQGVEGIYGIEETSIRAIEAGVDIVLISHTYEKQKNAIRAVKQAVESGRISEERINESYQRVIRLKEKRVQSEVPSFDADQFATKEHLETAQRISEHSVTVVKKDSDVLPLNTKAKTVVCWPEIGVTSIADEVYRNEKTLYDCLQDTFTNIDEIKLEDLSNTEDAAAKIKDAEQVIIASYNASSNKVQKEWIDTILETATGKTILCSFRNPYDIGEFPAVNAAIAAYELQPISMLSVAKVLTGERIAVGKCPVTVG